LTDTTAIKASPANPNVTGKIAVDGLHGSRAALHGDYGCLVVETQWVILDRARWEQVKTTADRILEHAESVEAQRLADQADDEDGEDDGDEDTEMSPLGDATARRSGTGESSDSD
jgi:hypothetical protein